MISCEHLSHLLAKEGPMTLMERWRAWSHLRVCAFCRAYKAQLKILNDKAKSLFRARLSLLTKDKVKNISEKVVSKIKGSI